MAKKKPKPGTRRARKKAPSRTDPELRTALLEAMAETASVTKACQLSGVPRRTAYKWRDAEDGFAAAWDEALDRGADALEDEAVRRAFDGVDRPVFQGGEEVGTIREYSDSMLMFLLRGRRPERYKDRVAAEHSGPGGRAIPIDWGVLLGEKPDPLESRIEGLKPATNGHTNGHAKNGEANGSAH